MYLIMRNDLDGTCQDVVTATIAYSPDLMPRTMDHDSYAYAVRNHHVGIGHCFFFKESVQIMPFSFKDGGRFK